MDERSLRELELLPVVRLYSMPPPAPADLEAATEPAHELHALASEHGDGMWIFVGMGKPATEAVSTLLEGMLAAIGCARPHEVDVAQIPAMKPRMLVALGEEAAVALLGAQGKLAGLRGRTFEYQGIPAVVTHSPAHLLRSLRDKADAWEDLVLARRKATPA